MREGEHRKKKCLCKMLGEGDRFNHVSEFLDMEEKREKEIEEGVMVVSEFYEVVKQDKEIYKEGRISLFEIGEYVFN